MIRIDEFYNNTIDPFLKHQVPLTRLFYCDPPGSTAPENLFNRGNCSTEHNYIFFHDQEPIHLDVHKPLFNAVVRRNLDLDQKSGPRHAGIVTSEKNSQFVEQACNEFGWNHHYYYFFHGWAALDWYRGYNRSFLMPALENRFISHSFISPNRIIGGKRDHRVLLMYHILRHGRPRAHISFPRRCPVEHRNIEDICEAHSARYPDIKQIFDSHALPWHFRGETDHPMHSCWLSLFEESAQSLLYMVTETVASGRRWHLTEKTFKPIALAMPFMILSTAGCLEYLRSYGFKTFAEFWDESYDQELDDTIRIEKIAKVLHDIDKLSIAQKNAMFQACRPVVQHNHDHFYNGGFEQQLWNELTHMLAQIKQDYA